MAVTLVCLAGNTLDDSLPPEIFWAGLALFPIGLVVYMRGSRMATAAADRRTRAALRPRIRNDGADAHARQQALNPVPATAEPAPRDLELPREDPDELGFANTSGTDAFAAMSAFDEVALDVTTDVSFPLEIQQEDSIARELERLQKLLSDGSITHLEFDAAKAKLFD